MCVGLFRGNLDVYSMLRKVNEKKRRQEQIGSRRLTQTDLVQEKQN